MSDDLIDMLIKVFHYGDNQLFDSVIDRLIKDVDELLTADMALEAAIKVAETLKTNTSVRYSSSFGIGILVKLGVISKPDPNYEVRLNLDV